MADIGDYDDSLDDLEKIDREDIYIIENHLLHDLRINVNRLRINTDPPLFITVSRINNYTYNDPYSLKLNETTTDEIRFEEVIESINEFLIQNNAEITGLTIEDQNQGLGTERYTAGRELPECPICGNFIKKGEGKKLVKCGHRYCKECIDNWFKRTQTCPMCRSEDTNFVLFFGKKRNIFTKEMSYLQSL